MPFRPWRRTCPPPLGGRRWRAARKSCAKALGRCQLSVWMWPLIIETPSKQVLVFCCDYTFENHAFEQRPEPIHLGRCTWLYLVLSGCPRHVSTTSNMGFKVAVRNRCGYPPFEFFTWFWVMHFNSSSQGFAYEKLPKRGPSPLWAHAVVVIFHWRYPAVRFLEPSGSDLRAGAPLSCVVHNAAVVGEALESLLHRALGNPAAN